VREKESQRVRESERELHGTHGLFSV